MDINSVSALGLGKKVIVTTDNWFFGPDGKNYRGVWGTLIGVFGSEQTLGVKTNARSTNWYVQVGDTLIAGCQIHYAVASEVKPDEFIEDYSVVDGVVKFYTRPTSILCSGKE